MEFKVKIEVWSTIDYGQKILATNRTFDQTQAAG